MTFVSLPYEILLLVIAELDLKDVLNLRYVNTQLAPATKDKTVWLQLGSQCMEYIPLPDKFRSFPSIQALDHDKLEALIRQSVLIHEHWLTSREPVTYHLPKAFTTAVGQKILDIEIYMGSWLIVVYEEGCASLWDIRSPQTAEKPVGTLVSHTPQRWISCVSQLHSSREYVVLALGGDISRSRISLCRVYLKYADPNACFQLYASIDLTPHLPVLSSLKEIDLENQILCFAHDGDVSIVQWEDEADSETQVEFHRIPIQTDDLEELFNAILAIRILPAGVFILKTRSAEVHPIPIALGGHDFPIARHTFSQCTFREVQLTECDKHSQGGQTVEVGIAASAYDVVLGLLLYRFTVSIPSAGPAPLASLDVRLVGVYPIGGSMSLRIFPAGALPRSNEGDEESQQLIVDQYSHITLTRRDVPTLTQSRGGSPLGSGSFVAAHCLGKQGMRAVWIQRSRARMIWQLVGCRLPALGRHDKMALAVELEGSVISSAESYDLREVWAHCAFEESSGLVAVGSRMGDILILPVHREA